MQIILAAVLFYDFIVYVFKRGVLWFSHNLKVFTVKRWVEIWYLQWKQRVITVLNCGGRNNLVCIAYSKIHRCTRWLWLNFASYGQISFHAAMTYFATQRAIHCNTRTHARTHTQQCIISNSRTASTIITFPCSRNMAGIQTKQYIINKKIMYIIHSFVTINTVQ